MNMSDAFITVQAPTATELADLVEEIPYQEWCMDTQVGGGPSVVIDSSSSEIDDADEVMDDIVDYSDVSASAVSIE